MSEVYEFFYFGKANRFEERLAELQEVAGRFLKVVPGTKHDPIDDLYFPCIHIRIEDRLLEGINPLSPLWLSAATLIDRAVEKQPGIYRRYCLVCDEKVRREKEEFNRFIASVRKEKGK